MPMRNYLVTGSYRKSGKDVTLTIPASSEEEAISSANRKGILITRVEIESGDDPLPYATPILMRPKKREVVVTLEAIISLIILFVLAISAFAPIVYLPIAGNISMMQQEFFGLAILVLAAGGIFLVLSGNRILLPVIGIVALVLIGLDLSHAQAVITDAKQSATTNLAGNPFESLAGAMIETASLDWGWIPLSLSAIALTIFPFLPKIRFEFTARND